MVARGAGVAGSVLLACRQWDPLGLARLLSSLGVGAWRSAPLLPWRVQCPVCVCAALAAGLGGSGRYLVSCLPRFAYSAPRVPRCVWRAVRSGCLSPSLAGTPFHTVCAFRELGPVAFLVFPACPLCVCVRSRSPGVRLPSPLPWLVWRAHLARSRRWALVGPLYAVRAPLRVLPRSLAPFGVPRGGGGPVPFPCYLAWGCAPPVGWVCASGGGGGWGGWAACTPRPPSVQPAGPVGRGVAEPRSVPLPSLDRQQSGCHWLYSGHRGRGPHIAPVRARLPSLGAVRVAPWRVGADSLVPRGSCGSRRLGRGGGPCSCPPLGRSSPAGGRGDHPLCLGGVGAGALAACGPLGGVGGGGSRRGPPALPLGGGPRFPTMPPSRRRRIPLPACVFNRGRGAASCTGCGPSGGGGGEGRPGNRSPGGPDRPKPSLRPP